MYYLFEIEISMLQADNHVYIKSILKDTYKYLKSLKRQLPVDGTICYFSKVRDFFLVWLIFPVVRNIPIFELG